MFPTEYKKTGNRSAINEKYRLLKTALVMRDISAPLITISDGHTLPAISSVFQNPPKQLKI